MKIEGLIVDYLTKPGFSFSTESERSSLIELESSRRSILLIREQEARQKSRAIWLVCGDDNTSFFHNFTNHHKNINSIWNIEGDDGLSVEGFDAIAKAGFNILSSCFRKIIHFIFWRL